MALFKLISLAGASLVFLQGTYGSGDGATGNVTVTDEMAIEEANCLSVLNDARKAVEFPEFKKGDKKLPLDIKTKSKEEDKKFWQYVCARIQGQTEPAELGTTKPEGTYAYFTRTTNDTECSAAVEYWKSGFAQFGTQLPGKYHEESDTHKIQAPYDLDKARSFVALYNPQPDAAVECAKFTCPEVKGQDGAPEVQKQGAKQGKGSGVDKVPAPESKGLLCLTYPKALNEGEAPFKEEQWKKITDVFAPSSASTAVPAFFAIAAAAVGLALY